MPSLRFMAKAALVRSFDLAGRLREWSGVPILCYHSIDDSGSLLSISPRLFAAQLEYLREQGYRTMPLKQLCDQLEQGRPLPRKTVVLTFDDGFRNNASTVLPLLHTYGFTATLFLVTGYTGKRIGWTRTADIPELEMASWDEVRQMAEGEFDIGAHSVSHPNLCRLSVDEIRREIADSKHEIEDRIGRAVTLFAYPYGEYDSRIQGIVEELGFAGAVTLVDGRTRPGDERSALKRINVTGISRVSDATKMTYFRCCVTGTASWYSGLKERFPHIVNDAAPWRDDARSA